MKKIVFITGAVRSGKSKLAVDLAKKSKKDVIFLATCRPADSEMKSRVRKHKLSRPKHWQTIEEEINICSALLTAGKKHVVILDCITLWISNLLTAGFAESAVNARFSELIDALEKTKSSVIIVSNEVGWGIVPANKLARSFRDIIGTAHQQIAKISDEVYLVTAGISLKLK